jgi:hypothetical protein
LLSPLIRDGTRTGTSPQNQSRTGERVAYIIPDEGLLTKAESKTLTYAQLAALKQRADAGDASAGIAFAQLPQPEQRLALGLVKAFTGKAEKPKKQKKVKKAERSSPDNSFRVSMEYTARNSVDPAQREAAWEVLRRM